MKNISNEIGLIELCFSGHRQEKKYQNINTELLNNLIFTINEQNKEIEQLKSSVLSVPLTNNFKEQRQKMRKSLRDIAKEVSISASTISRIENGKESEFSNIKKLYDYFTANGI